jgi:hypothetical protein
MGKDLRKMTRQEQAAYFKSKDFCGEELKIVMDAVSYGISADYLQLFEDTALPAEIMENMFTAMKEDYGVDSVSFLSAIHKGESGRIILEALKSGVPLQELKGIFRNDMLPVELREKILPLMQGREAIPEKIGEKMEFITEAVKELKESLLRQDSFIADLRKSMEEKQEIFSALQKETEAEAEAGVPEDAYYLELEEQFRQAREDAERLLEERENTNRRLQELEGENKSLHEQLMAQQSLVTELQEKQIKYVQESRNVQWNQETDSDYRTKASQAVRNVDYQKVRAVKSGSREKQNIFSFFHFPFTRKKPCLMEKLAGELDAGQIAEIRLGIEDGLDEGQLILLATGSMDAEKIRELRMTMKILNERGQGK